MTKMNIKKGDTVVVLAGKDKGKQGEVLRAYPEKQRVAVKDVQIARKALRPTQANPQGGIASIEMPIHVSNVMLVCPECKQPTRVSVVRNEHGKKIRVCKKCSKQID